jgi:hypothetical protein
MYDDLDTAVLAGLEARAKGAEAENERLRAALKVARDAASLSMDLLMKLMAYIGAIVLVLLIAAVWYCPHCRCKTWHCDGVCEWADMHKTK